MSTGAYLSRAELRDLAGRRNLEAVLAWLKGARLPYLLDADGWPKVLRAVHDKRLGLADQAAPAQDSEPDFSAINQVRRHASR